MLFDSIFMPEPEDEWFPAAFVGGSELEISDRRMGRVKGRLDTGTWKHGRPWREYPAGTAPETIPRLTRHPRTSTVLVLFPITLDLLFA